MLVPLRRGRSESCRVRQIEAQVRPEDSVATTSILLKDFGLSSHPFIDQRGHLKPGCRVSASRQWMMPAPANICLSKKSNGSRLDWVAIQNAFWLRFSWLAHIAFSRIRFSRRGRVASFLPHRLGRPEKGAQDYRPGFLNRHVCLPAGLPYLEQPDRPTKSPKAHK